MPAATVATTSSRALLAGCRRLHLDVDGLLTTAGLTAEAVNDADGRLPLERVALLWRTALEQSGDPGLGLHVALAVPFGAYQVIDFLAASAPTVGEGLTRVVRYFPLINSALHWRVTHADGQRVLTLLYDDPDSLPRPYAEYALTVTVLHCRHAAGFQWPLRGVSFTFAPPPSSGEYEHAFAAPVSFNASTNSFTVADEVWDRATQAPSSSLLATLESHAQGLLDSLGAQDMAAQVARMAVDLLEGGHLSLSKVARRLAVSPRTLQRRLVDEGTSFDEVCDRTRRHVAQTYVDARDLSLTEVAYLLGFSEQSAFSRAFRRWFGMSPSEYRQRA